MLDEPSAGLAPSSPGSCSRGPRGADGRRGHPHGRAERPGRARRGRPRLRPRRGPRAHRRTARSSATNRRWRLYLGGVPGTAGRAAESEPPRELGPGRRQRRDPRRTIGLGAIGVTLTYSILRFANFTHGDLIAWAPTSPGPPRSRSGHRLWGPGLGPVGRSRSVALSSRPARSRWRDDCAGARSRRVLFRALRRALASSPSSSPASAPRSPSGTSSSSSTGLSRLLHREIQIAAPSCPGSA